MRIGNLAKAETLFRQALEHDVNFGPAHNNLGHIYLARHQLYLAAWEFEYASRLMPELAEPIINQGLAYETAEQLGQALAFYQVAHERFPTHPIAIASLVRTHIKMNGPSEAIGALLDQLILHDSRQNWIEWAKELRQTKYRSNCEECIPVEVYSDSILDTQPMPTTSSPEWRQDAVEELNAPTLPASEALENESGEMTLPMLFREHGKNPIQQSSFELSSSDLDTIVGSPRPKRIQDRSAVPADTSGASEAISFDTLRAEIEDKLR
ncbi:MAG: hypothetical protein AAFX06_21240 [Planctomycetota bacterium]